MILNQARIPGTDEHLKVVENLQKAWAALDSNSESFALHLLRSMFKLDPTLFERFPFASDEKSHIAYQDFHGE